MPQREENDEIKRRQKELRTEGIRMSFHATKRLLETEKRLAAAIEQKQPAEDEPNPFDEKIQLKLEQAKPSFLSDGLGLRGPQNPLTNLSIDGADGRGRDMQVKRETSGTGNGMGLAGPAGEKGDPSAGEGVFTNSLGGGIVLIIDSGASLVDTVSVKSLRDGDGILLGEAVAGEVSIEVALSTTFDKSIALSFATGTVYAEWFYANTTEGAGYINLITGIDADDGATFRAVKKDNGQAIVADIDGAGNLVFSWIAGNLTGTGTHTVYEGIGDIGGGVIGAKFKKFEAGTNITFTGSTPEALKINSTGGAGGAVDIDSSDGSIDISPSGPSSTPDIIVAGTDYYIIVPCEPVAGGILTMRRLTVRILDSDSQTQPYTFKPITICEDGDPVTNFNFLVEDTS